MIGVTCTLYGVIRDDADPRNSGACAKWRALIASSLLALAGIIVMSAASPSQARLAGRATPYCKSNRKPKGCIRVPSGAKRPSKSVNQQGGPVLTPPEVADGGGLGGGPDEGRSSALVWARTQLDSSIWAYRCERFVEEAYGTRYIFPTAWDAATHLPLKHSSISSAPAGSLVFFGPDSANSGFGHVGLSLGAGKMISALNTVRITDVARSRYWSNLYRGWAYAPASWPGRIPPPPASSGPLVSSAVQITAPAFGSLVSGTITLEASAANVSGVAFEAYYATDPANIASLGWHLLGNALPQGSSWALEWNSTTIPDQGNAAWGTVNLAAIALDAAGSLTGTRDYRRIALNNSASAVSKTTTPPPSEAPTYPETVGGVAHTWTNYVNASGNEGPEIPSNTTVQISCKIAGFAVADGDTWWYRIASSPWSNAYYVSADAFYNNGATSGSLKGTPFVDPGVPSC